MTYAPPIPPIAPDRANRAAVTWHAVARYRERVPLAAAWSASEIRCRIMWHVRNGESDGGKNGRCRLVRHAGLAFVLKGGRVLTVILPWMGWDGSGPRRRLERRARRRLLAKGGR